MKSHKLNATNHRLLKAYSLFINSKCLDAPIWEVNTHDVIKSFKKSSAHLMRPLSSVFTAKNNFGTRSSVPCAQSYKTSHHGQQKTDFKRKALIFSSLGIPCVILDQMTKACAEVSLKMNDPQSFFGGKLHFAYAENKGALGGLGADLPRPFSMIFFCAGAVCLIVLFLKVLFHPKTKRLSHQLALSFMIAGGLSNVIDRLISGFVVDFLSLPWGALEHVFFNIADLSIVTGFGIFCLDFVVPQKHPIQGIPPPIRRVRPSVVRR
jgi:signal peptidase II